MSCLHINTLIDTAKLYATVAHGAVGQVRKYTNEPYIVHPEAVVNILVDNIKFVNTKVLCAAYLHDVVEDTKLTIADIRFTFSHGVAILVDELTDKYTDYFHGDRATRKALELSRIAQISPEAKTVKLADIIDNTKSIVKHDPEFARVYIQEKLTLLEVLTEGDKGLWNIAYNNLIKSVEELKNA